QQITKAMKIVSGAKLRKAQEAIVSLRYLSEKLLNTLLNVLQTPSDTENKLAEVRPVKSTLMIIIAGNRGLCGAYNTNIIKQAKGYMDKQKEDQEIIVWTIGKKAYDGIIHLPDRYLVEDRFTDIYQKAIYTDVQECAESAIKFFLQKKVDKVIIVYSKFKNAATQHPIVEDFLPLVASQNPTKKVVSKPYFFEPSESQVISTLMPLVLKIQLFNAIKNGIASEYGARMTAMNKASDNANELLRSLRLAYNSARQAKITTELNEIVSGANALNG
ncbi:MAG: ATP synthase F1 subunit gamma, partial [Chitinophagaceae bacterium]